MATQFYLQALNFSTAHRERIVELAQKELRVNNQISIRVTSSLQVLPEMLGAVLLWAQAPGEVTSVLQKHPDIDCYCLVKEKSEAPDYFDAGAHFVFAREDFLGPSFVTLLRRSIERRYLLQKLGETREKATRAEKLKAEFLSLMSHEVRTPLNGILGMSSVLLKSKLTTDMREALGVIRRSGDHLLKIVNDVLQLSLSEVNKTLENQRFSTSELISDVIELHSHFAHAKGIVLNSRVDSNVPKQLSGDVAALRQILSNILGNAVRFTSNGGVALRVTAECVGKADVLCRFSIKDTGPGMDSSVCADLFQPFVVSQEGGGIGLGLVIAERLTKKLGGTLSMRTALGLGSEFELAVTLGALSAPASFANEPKLLCSVEGGPRRTVLIAEDNAVNQLVAERMLSKLGLDYVSVKNGREAVRAADTHRFWAVLMDCRMPEMDGFEATRILRQKFSKEELPIIAMTANAMPGDSDKCFSCGMNDYLTKPVCIEDLSEVFQRRHFLQERKVRNRMGATQSDELTLSFDDLAIIDDETLEALREIDGDSSLVNQLANLFAESIPALLEKWNEAYRNKEVNNIATIAHRFKGSAGNLGILKLSKVAEKIEFLARSGDASVFNMSLNSLFVKFLSEALVEMKQRSILAESLVADLLKRIAASKESLGAEVSTNQQMQL